MNMIEIIFEKTDGIYTLRDAIVITSDQYANMTELDIDAEKQIRFDNYVQFIKNTSESVEEDNINV